MNTKQDKNLVDLTSADIQTLVSTAEVWLQQSGQKAIEKVINKATEASNKLSMDRLVDPQTLRMPLNL